MVSARAGYQRRAGANSRPVSDRQQSTSSRSLASCAVAPPFETLPCGPKDKHADDGAGGVDKYVGDHRGTSRHEHLEKFIGGGVEEYDENGDGGFAPAPGARVATDGFAHCAPKQDGEDGVFGEVTAFANHMMNGFDVRLGHVREQPVQQGFNQSRGVSVRFGISGADKDERHPRQGHEPVF